MSHKIIRQAQTKKEKSQDKVSLPFLFAGQSQEKEQIKMTRETF